MAGREFKSITAEIPIIGFTGALGSGCSYLAKGLADFHNFRYCSLSKPIHTALAAEGRPATSSNLQDMGNKLRLENGPDCLVLEALQSADAEFENKDDRPAGLVVDGIRNTAEVNALRAWPHFYLISVQADRELRKNRGLRQGNRFKDEGEFWAADARDAEEQKPYGQQVRRCNYLSDIIVLNETEISDDAPLNRQRYISDKLYNPYVMLIEHLARGNLPRENKARPDESLMTQAYVESKRSSCLKRRVGAVIASKDGHLLAAGHNDVPESMEPCLEDSRYQWCARDVLQEAAGQAILHCPKCGTPLAVAAKCPVCGQETNTFVKRCPKCRSDWDIEYRCPTCEAEVFREFLPGADPNKTGKLLDMCRALHAEENAILALCVAGVKLADGAVLYCTTFPCNLCANKIVTVGIREVVYAEPYPMCEAEKVFREKGVRLRRFEGVKSNAYFRIYP